MTVEMERDLLIAGLLALAAATVLDRLLRASGRSPDTAIATFAGVATLLVAGAIAVRWIREQQGPFLTLYDVLLSNLFSLALVFLVVFAIAPTLRVTSVIVLPLLLVLGGWLLVSPAAAVLLPATFDNGWLWLHVAAGKVFLGLCMLAAAASTLLLARRSITDAVRLDGAIWPVIAIAFIAHSFMLIAGTVWAHNAWGRYWAWDPLETWSLITWLCLGLLLHARVTWRNLPKWVGQTAVVIIFGVSFLTFFGVPFLSQAPHKGVM